MDSWKRYPGRWMHLWFSQMKKEKSLRRSFQASQTIWSVPGDPCCHFIYDVSALTDVTYHVKFNLSRLGAAWKGLSDEARKKYHDLAHREDLEHRRRYPSWLLKVFSICWDMCQRYYINISDYQYCPGHARKLKKARREQRMRQQNNYRAARQVSAATNLATKDHQYNGQSGTGHVVSSTIKVGTKILSGTIAVSLTVSLCSFSNLETSSFSISIFLMLS